MLNNFLADIYFGHFDHHTFDRYEISDMDDNTRSIVDRYLDIRPPNQGGESGEPETLPREYIDQLRRIGFFGLNIPAQYGGLGLGLRQYLKVVEVIITRNMALGFTALAHLSIGVKGIVLFGTDDQKNRYLPPAAAGDLIFSYALTEPKHGSDARNVETLAMPTEDGQGYILNGTKTYITNANYAGAMTVFAQMDPENPGHMGAFIVETGWDGVKIGKDMPKMGLKASSTAAVKFDHVRVPRQNLLGRPGDGFKIAMTILNHGRLALGAGSRGMIRQSLTDMRKRAASRRQFGKPIQEFELIQEMIVRAMVNDLAVSAVTDFTAARLETDPMAPVAIESSHCKLLGTTRAWETLYDALQVAGGAGYLSTQPYEKRMRDFRVTTIFEGTTEIHSMYPALYTFRQLSKRLKALSTDKMKMLGFIVKALLKPNRWRFGFHQRQMNQAAGLARSLAMRIRWLTCFGLLRYGGRVGSKQFFLRKISILSLYLYSLLSILAQLQSARRQGRPISDDLVLLGVVMAEAREFKKNKAGLLPGPRERLTRLLATRRRQGRGLNARASR